MHVLIDLELVLTCLLALCGVATADAQADERETRLSALLEAVAAGEEVESGAAEFVPELIALVDSEIPYESQMALRALAAIGPDAAPAVAVLCQTLTDADHAQRSLAVDALVAIGDASIEPLRETLTSTSGRARAAATVTLHRLGALTIDEVNSLASDGDPRVRAAIAVALVDADRPGVAMLVPLLADNETAVAVQAALSLKFNRSDASIAIPSLIDVLPRDNVGWAAADALSAYGIEAQRAIPALIASHPLGREEPYDYEDASELALQHIGPPHVDDVAALCESLAHPDEDARILAANTISLLGPDGAAAADALEAAITETIERYLEVKQASEMNPDDYRLQPGRWHLAASDMLAALWTVTHDVDRFLAALDRATAQSESNFRWNEPHFWQHWHASEQLLIEPLLRSPDESVQLGALTGIRNLGPAGAPLKDVLLELAKSEEGEVAEQIAMTLHAIEPRVAEGDSLATLLENVRSGEIRIREFAEAIEELGQSSEEADGILRYGVERGDAWTSRACVRALLSASTVSDENALNLLDRAREGDLADIEVIEALHGSQAAPGDVIPYLIGQLSNEDYWTRRAAARALGEFGETAAPAIPSLREQLADDQGLELPLQAAQSIMEITGDAAEFDAQLEKAFASDRWDRLDAIEVIAELGSDADEYLPYIADELNNPDYLSENSLIDALVTIGSDNALALLRETAESRDWVLRSAAREALEMMPKKEEVHDE